MQGKSYFPHQSLQDFVLGISAIDFELPSTIDSAVTPYPPTPLQSIMFYFDHPIEMQREGADLFQRQSPAIVIGPQYTRVNIKVTKKLKAVRVDFKPAGLFGLLKFPMCELFDQGAPADSILGNDITHLNEKMLNAKGMDEAVHYVQEFLIAKMLLPIQRLPFDHAIATLVSTDGALSIEKTASLACMSVRQFERVCIERIGMTPKSFARIVRFSKAYRLREKQPELSWLSIALEAGYFDQMHLVKDFKQFAGTTPTLLDGALRVTPLRMQKNIL